MKKYLNFYQKSKKSKYASKISKHNAIRRSGYGYLKRRLGLLSNEVDKMIADGTL